MTSVADLKIFVSALVAKVLTQNENTLVSALASKPEAVVIAQSFNSSLLIRQLRLVKDIAIDETLLKLDPQQGNQVFYQGQLIGHKQILYKSPLPGELQARLAIESITDRFLEYLQKVHQIIVLNESERHVQVFIPYKSTEDFKTLWNIFLINVAFSGDGNTKFQLPGLIQTFIVLLNAITLSDRGFSTLDVPILTKEQSNILVAWYYAVIKNVEKRQSQRQNQISKIREELSKLNLVEKDKRKKQKELIDKEKKQAEEAEKYTEAFQKGYAGFIQSHKSTQQQLQMNQEKLLNSSNLNTTQRKNIEKDIKKLEAKIRLNTTLIEQKYNLVQMSDGNPFKFINLDEECNPGKFKQVYFIAKIFTKTATEQIAATKGAIFNKCISEMYRLLESEQNEPLPQPILTEQPVLPQMRSPGDDSKEFCYSCGVKLDPKTAKWQVLRFMFERPSQRRQSASSEGRPHICVLCSALAFASPLKVTEESIILRLEPINTNTASELKVKDYIRMLTNKENHLCAGKYVIFTSEFVMERTEKGDKKIFAYKKLGQVQYALAKVASIFPLEVFGDFDFFLTIQGSQPVHLLSRHLVFIKGLIEYYSQSIVMSDKEINMALGEAIRYVEQDLPYLAEYTLTKIANTSKQIEIEQVRETYYKTIEKNKGDSMSSDSQLSRRAKLYGDIAALTGLTYAFAQSLESTVKRIKPEDTEREVSKLIEKVDDAVAFCYYATHGDENKTSVEARLWKNSDNYFIYKQTQNLLKQLEISGREEKDESGKTWLKLYADDVLKAYTYFAENGYPQDKDWKDLTYQLKLSLYTRFPELVRKLKSTSDK